jgi:hypothetical protein
MGRSSSRIDHRRASFRSKSRHNGIAWAMLLLTADAFAQFGDGMGGFGRPSYGQSILTRLVTLFLAALVSHLVGPEAGYMTGASLTN